MDKTLLFIVNPRAGKTKSSAPLFDAVATFGRAGYLVRVMLTQAAGDAARFAAQWGGDYDLVVCAGGDGTLNEVISGCHHQIVSGALPGGGIGRVSWGGGLVDPDEVTRAGKDGQRVKQRTVGLVPPGPGIENEQQFLRFQE